MATLKDVARLANVDISTVSRALNNTSYVHPDTKAKIYAAVKELSYQPNLLAKGLRQGKRHTIGVVIPSIHLTVFGEITQSIELHSRNLGYQTLICNTADNPTTEEECLTRLRSGFVDGIIIASTGQNQRLLRDINTNGIPIVQIVRKQDKLLSSIVANYYNCGYESVYFLYRKGCRHIGFIKGPMEILPLKERYEGYHKAIKKLKLSENVSVFNSLISNHFDNGYQSTHSLLEQNPHLDGIIVEVDMQGLGAIRALKERNILIPQQIKLLSLTGHSIGGMLETSMTSMEMPAAEIGKSATKMLIEAINSSSNIKPSLQHTIFEPSLIERETT